MRRPPIGKPLTITDGNGNNVANNATHIANLNPLRYRSYVYDNESGFYYLMSRYYDPTVGRFISPDGQLNLSTMHGCNLYAYCENDPVNYVDPTGRSAILALFVITAVSGFFACASPAGQARTEEAFSNPSFYSIGNWLTMGALGMVKGAVAPAQPFSAQHWIDSAGTAMLLMPAIGFADDVARSASRARTPVIGKMMDLNNTKLKSNEFKVADLLPDQGNPKANWKQNSSVLRSLMNGSPIRDVSPYPMKNAGFLGAERNLLENHGYVYRNGYWIIP